MATENHPITLTREAVREVDRLAIEDLGIPGIVLMENAGRHVADTALELLELELHLLPHDARTAVLCGGGNNGGDGYVVARQLYNAGVNVTAFAAKDPSKLTSDAETNYWIVHNIGSTLPLHGAEAFVEAHDTAGQFHLIVDALLGTGFRGQVRDDLVAVIDACNNARVNGARVLSVDIPSGLDCNTGEPSNATVAADVTVTFVAMKTGLASETAHPYVGQIHVAEIGAPPELVQLVLQRGDER